MVPNFACPAGAASHLQNKKRTLFKKEEEKEEEENHRNSAGMWLVEPLTFNQVNIFASRKEN